MELIDEVLSFAREYINLRYTRTPERKAKIRQVIKKITGEKLEITCGTCYIEALFKIINLSQMASSKYELKKGVLLEAFGDPSKTCTNLTLTDELGDWYMKNYPEKIVFFARVPQDIPAGVPPEIKIITPKEPVPDVPDPAEIIEKVTNPRSNKGKPKK